MASKGQRSIVDVIVENGLAPDPQHARTLLNCGLVLLGDSSLSVNSKIDPQDFCKIRIKHQKRFVGRGAVKLQTVFDKFSLDAAGTTCLDIGASTGGFTQLLLEKGAAKVYSVDVGEGILDHKLRTDPRVVVWEGVNVRNFNEYPDKVKILSEQPADICVIDVSFISLSLIIPVALRYIKNKGYIIPLVKPQFEAEKGEIGKGGIVRDDAVRQKVLKKIEKLLLDNGCRIEALIESGIKGGKGNTEYFYVALKM